MDEYTFAIHEKDLTNGMMKTVLVGNNKIALANIDGQIFAIDDTCSHKECSLGTEGALDGNVVICGCHGAKFDMSSGEVMSLPAVTNVRIYAVKIENGDVWVKV
ncbi:MAG: non-heme iron oxygenase ferredoxin subunit [Patescibacteria group bacterium]